MSRLPLFLLGFLSLSSFAAAQGVRGTWKTPGGAVIGIAPCGNDLCATLLQLEPNTPVRLDTRNPDAGKRGQSLCGLQIGYGFHLLDGDHADGGYLYDPKSGKTYRGTLASHGDQLDLRGYVGIKAFGRTEQWTRSSAPQQSCR